MEINSNFKPSILRSVTLFRGTQAYLILLLTLSFYYLIRWPIVALDTDLWYHLNGGRYILENKSLPTTSFFSFISPPREWIDYYWLFQVVVYKIYVWGDYYGLVILRAMIYLGTLSILCAYLFEKQEKNGFLLYLAFVFSLFLLFLLPRSLLMRPHSFSYLFIVAFLYILEFHPRQAVFLPFLAILWNNLHGVEYPVMLLIVFAYVLEFLIIRYRSKSQMQKKELVYILSLVFCMATVYITPHGPRLMGVPLIPTDFAAQYVSELKKIPLNELLTFQVLKVFSASTTTFNIVFVLAFFSAAKSILRGHLRISHLIMLAGGIILLTKATRFIYEFAILSLPFLRLCPMHFSLPHLHGKLRFAWSIAIVIVLSLPLLWLNDFFGNKPKFPFSPSQLPQGIVAFLNRIPAGGSILNHPNKGGYLQWMINPRYKIFMDMEVPFLFADEDFFTAHHAFGNEEVLKKILWQYDPSFITVAIVSERFKGIIDKFPDYELIFFDHAEVLYLNKSHYPEIAAKYRIKEIDPFELSRKSVDATPQKTDQDSFLQEMDHLLQIDPECLLKNQIMAMVYNKRGEYKKALPYAEAVIRNFPESGMGYCVKGDAFTGMKLYDEALSLYEMALQRLDPVGKRGVYKKIGFVYAEKEQMDQAYRALKKAIRPLAEETSYKDLTDFGAIALSAGKPREAYTLLKFAEAKVPPEDTLWLGKIRKCLSMIRIENEK